MKNRIDEAVIADYDCGYCQDTGIQTGIADLDGEKVLVIRPCMFCDKANRLKKGKEKDGVIYDF